MLMSCGSEPKRLCRFLLQSCLDQGVQLHNPAIALSVSTDARDELASVRVGHTLDSTETDIPCTRLVITAGAWSPQVFKTLFQHSGYSLPVTSLAGHSLIVRSPAWNLHSTDPAKEPCYALFSTMGEGFSPEMISRLGGEIYIAGVNSSTLPLPKLPGEAQVLETEMAKLRVVADELVAVSGEEGEKGELEVVREAVCFRPVTPAGRPLLLRLSDEKLGINISTRPGSEGGVFVAAGHGPWGISLSLGTGKVMAEMIQGRELSADVGALGSI